jgi:hypothetical protein
MRISFANTKGYLVRVRKTRVGSDIDISDVKIFASARRPGHLPPIDESLIESKLRSAAQDIEED